MLRMKKVSGENASRLLGASLFWLGVIIFLFVPVLNSFVIQTALMSINGNIAYEEVYPVLDAVADILSVITAYAGIGLLAVSLAYFGLKKAKGVVILAALSHFMVFISSLITYALSGADDYETAVFFLGTDMLAGIIIYALVVAAILHVRIAKEKNELPLHPELDSEIIGKGGMFSYIFASVGVYFGAQLVIKLYDMLSAFLDPSIGLPINVQEWLYWVSEYLTLIIYGAIGYFTALALCYLCKYYTRHFEKRLGNKSAARTGA